MSKNIVLKDENNILLNKNGIIDNDFRSFILKNYWINEPKWEVLWDNENLIIWFSWKVIRIKQEWHRTSDEFKAELYLLEILKNNNAPVVRIINSNLWNSFEKYNKNWNNFYISAFERLQNGKIWIKINVDKEWKEVINKWGETMGIVHRITQKEYQNIDYQKRINWDKDIIIDKAKELLPKEDSFILDRLYLLMNSLKLFSKGNSDFWLVHTDMRPRNFNFYNWEIIHFDFDDITNHWYIYDIAVSILHEIELINDINERMLFMEIFLKEFMSWYRKECYISPNIFKNIIILMELRLVYAYIDYYKRLKIKNVEQGKEKMLLRRKYILNLGKFINLDEANNITEEISNNL